MNFSVTLSGKDQLDKKLDINDFKKAVARSLNKTLAKAKTAASKNVTGQWNISNRDLSTTATGKARLKTYSASSNKLNATLFITGRSISLSYFNAVQYYRNTVSRRFNGSIKTTKARRGAGPVPQGVKVEVHKGHSVLLRNTFMMKMQSGHIGVMYRSGKKIAEKKVITVPSMFNGADVERVVWEVVDRDFNGIFAHEAAYLLSKRS